MKMINLKWSRNTRQSGHWHYEIRDLYIPISDIQLIIQCVDEEDGNKTRVKMKTGETFYSSYTPDELVALVIKL